MRICLARPARQRATEMMLAACCSRCRAPRCRRRRSRPVPPRCRCPRRAVPRSPSASLSRWWRRCRRRPSRSRCCAAPACGWRSLRRVRRLCLCRGRDCRRTRLSVVGGPPTPTRSRDEDAGLVDVRGGVVALEHVARTALERDAEAAAVFAPVSESWLPRRYCGHRRRRGRPECSPRNGCASAGCRFPLEDDSGLRVARDRVVIKDAVRSSPMT